MATAKRNGGRKREDAKDQASVPASDTRSEAVHGAGDPGIDRIDPGEPQIIDWDLPPDD